MQIFKLIFLYFTNAKYRYAVKHMAYLIKNREEIETDLEKSLNEIKISSLKTIKERIDSLVHVKDYIADAEVSAKLNNVINGMKADYIDIENS